MTVYAVFLNEPNPNALDRLKAEWPKPDHLIVTDSLALISTDKGITAEDVTDVVGMNKEQNVSGIVSRVDYTAVNGWNRQSIWQWLADKQ